MKMVDYWVRETICSNLSEEYRKFELKKINGNKKVGKTNLY